MRESGKQVESERRSTLAEENLLLFIETSAKTGDCVSLSFYTVASKIIKEM